MTNSLSLCVCVCGHRTGSKSKEMPKGKDTRHKKHGRGLFFSNIQLLLHFIIIPIYIPNWWSLVAGGILVSSLKTLQPTVTSCSFHSHKELEKRQQMSEMKSKKGTATTHLHETTNLVSTK